MSKSKLVSVNYPPKQITIKFTEQVNAAWPDFTALMIDGAHRTISGLVDGNNGRVISDTVKLTVLSPDIPHDAVSGNTITIASHDKDDMGNDVSLLDLAGNQLKLTAEQKGETNAVGAVPFDGNPRLDVNGFSDWPIMQGQVPMLTSAMITDRNTVTLVFSIPVNATTSDFTFTLNGEATPRNITAISGSGTETIMLTVSGTMLPEAQGTIDLASTVIGTNSGAALVADSDVSVLPGQAPAITSAMVTAADRITVVFTVDVDADKENYVFTLDDGTTFNSDKPSRLVVGAVEISLITDDDDGALLICLQMHR